MKKKILFAVFLLISMGVNAQVKSVQLELLVGFNTNKASEIFTEPKIGYNFGMTARKEIVSSKNDKFGLYGLTGLILTQRGGKTDNDVMTLGDGRKNLSIHALSLPIHIGAECKWKKVSLFADLGPNVLFKVGGGMENLKTQGATFGGGFNIGVRFKRFAISFGIDQDFTKLAKFEPDSDQQDMLDLSDDVYDLKTGEFHFDLRWTFGKSKRR